MDHLLVRADASTEIGTGHVMRCLALAQAWQQFYGAVTLVTRSDLSPFLADRFQHEGMQIRPLDLAPGSEADAYATLMIAQEIGAHYVVVDGYNFGSEYQLLLKNADLRVLFVDDIGSTTQRFYADLVLNQNIYASEALYPYRATTTELLLGTQYVLLRQEFWQWQNWRQEISPKVRKMVITMGGSDPLNVTQIIIKAIRQIESRDLEIVAIAGSINRNYQSLESVAVGSAIQIVRNVADMPTLLAETDLAISGSGSTCWELAFLGVPALVVILADNQQSIAEHLDALKIVGNLGWYDRLSEQALVKEIYQLLGDPARRRHMSHKGRQIVDGQGAFRVVKALKGEQQ